MFWNPAFVFAILRHPHSFFVCDLLQGDEAVADTPVVSGAASSTCNTSTFLFSMLFCYSFISLQYIHISFFYVVLRFYVIRIPFLFVIAVSDLLQVDDVKEEMCHSCAQTPARFVGEQHPKSVSQQIW